MRHRSNQERKLARQKTRTTNVIAVLYATRCPKAEETRPASWIEQAVEAFHREEKENAQREGQSRLSINQKNHFYCIVREEVCQDGEV